MNHTIIDGTRDYSKTIELYVDSENGNDGNTGDTPEEALRTLERAIEKAGQKMTINIISEEVKTHTKNAEPKIYNIHYNTLIRGLGVYDKVKKDYDKSKINRIYNSIFEVDSDISLTLQEVQLLTEKEEVVQNFIKNEGLFHNLNPDKGTIEINGADIDITHAKIKPTLTITTYDILEGDTEHVQIRLTGKESIGITGKVTVTIAQQKHVVDVTEGRGVLDLKELVPGSYLVEAIFEGDEKYDSATTYSSFRVEKNDFDYYVDSVRGSDDNTGISPNEPYKSLDKALSGKRDKRIALINERTE